MKIKSKFAKIIIYGICIMVAFISLFPIYYTFINAIRNVASTPAILLPKDYEWINFEYAVTMIPFLKYLKNSLIILGISVTLGTVFCFVYGYALAKLPAPGNQFLFFLVLTVMMIPSFATQIPQYIMFKKIGIDDTFWIWVFEAIAGSAYNIFLCRQFLSTLPNSLLEAATIDGCSQAKLISHIALPLSKPLLAIVAFNLFNLNWGDFMTPYMYLSKDKYPLIMPLFSGFEYVFPGTSIKMVPVVNAATLIVMIPVFIVFFMCQKQLVEGITSSGIKG